MDALRHVCSRFRGGVDFFLLRASRKGLDSRCIIHKKIWWKKTKQNNSGIFLIPHSMIFTIDSTVQLTFDPIFVCKRIGGRTEKTDAFFLMKSNGREFRLSVQRRTTCRLGLFYIFQFRLVANNGRPEQLLFDSLVFIYSRFAYT